MKCSACGIENRQILLDHAELLSGARRDDEAAPLLAHAGTIFERLGAKPWLERAQALTQVVPA